MGFDFNRDIGLMLAGPLASDAVLRPGLSTQRELRCIFDEDYYAASMGLVEMNTAQAAATCKPSDVADAAKGDEFQVDGRTFKVGRVQSDGSGWSLVTLREAGA
ncbi:MAG: hypothetical protein K9K65_11635 [Desulfarculaceae bacterium]|nr:hypothetical protein [Desulfarculaceae bacterium]MCF8064446.1 hypothetical protein [Desulfarculaceae bacterium]MCF8098485.1 hypothetical protein [Desulfarculaceae bacterium]MCF8122306.1 hypothetical protein [Desulfarculaceae bacterium]